MFKYVQIVYALSPRDPDCLHWPLICQDLLMDPWTLYKAISLHPDPRIRTLSGWVKVTKVTETWECCSFKFWMKQGTRRKLPSLDAAVSPRQGDDGYIIAHRFIMINRYHISHALWKVLKTLPKDLGLCSFTSRSRLFALTTHLPGPADGPLNIVEGIIFASWSKNQKPFRMSEGDESDGNLGVLLIRILDDTRYSSRIAISWCSCLATSRWWWIHNRSSMSYLTKTLSQVLKILPKDPGLYSKFSMLFHLAIQIARNGKTQARF